MAVAPGAQARGSHGCSAWVEEVGAASSELAADAVVELAAVDEDGVEDEELEDDEDEGVDDELVDDDTPAAVGVGEVLAAGALTANWLPVMTVTSAPSVTTVGS